MKIISAILVLSQLCFAVSDYEFDKMIQNMTYEWEK